MGELARWSVKVSKETDISLRTHLAEHGGKRGDLSKFVEQAVNNALLRATIQEIRDQNAHVPGDVLRAEIDQAYAEGRAEFWKNRKAWAD